MNDIIAPTVPAACHTCTAETPLLPHAEPRAAAEVDRVIGTVRVGPGSGCPTQHVRMWPLP